MKMQRIGKITGLLTVVGGMLMAMNAMATITVDMGSYGVGYITPTVIPPSGFNTTYVQNMVDTYNSGSDQTIGAETYTIDQGTFTPPPVLPDALSITSETSVGGSPLTYNIDLGAGGLGDYLVAQWDGPNGADAIYYIGGLTGEIQLQNLTDFVNATGGAYGLSGVWTVNPIPEPTTVIAGLLLLLPLGASTIRILRKKQTV